MAQNTAPQSLTPFNWKFKLFLVLIISLGASCVLLYLGVTFSPLPQPLRWNSRNPTTSYSITSSRSKSSEVTSSLSSQCGDVLGSMLKGRWHPRPMTSDDVNRIKLFQIRVEKEQKLPRGNEQVNKRCGNVSLGWFTALCNPDGPTPCCYNNVCRSKTRQQCTCPNCLDMRNTTHAEYATWRPLSQSCQPGEWTVNAICRLLHNATLHFIGDSLVRHVYTALLLAARGDFQTGAMKGNISPELRLQCSGLNMFSNKVCRELLDRNPTLCNGSLSVALCEPCHVNHTNKVHKAVLDLGNRSRSLVFMEVGLHNRLQVPLVQQQVMKPLLQTLRSRRLTSPFLLWAAVHHFGVMRTPFNKVNNAAVRAFNANMEAFLADYGVPVFDTYNLTQGVASFDGTHYGLGVNAMKVTILLHYLQELRSQGKW